MCGGYLGSCQGCGWILSVDAVFLNREINSDYELISDQGSGAELLNVDDFDFNGGSVGPRISLIRPRTGTGGILGTCPCWEINYFGVDWDDSITPVAPTTPVLNLTGTSLPTSAPGNVLNAIYSSELNSLEFNLRRDVNDCLTLLMGYRWVELSEDLIVDEVGSGTATNFYTVDTNNHMHGFQLGAEAEIWKLRRPAARRRLRESRSVL